MPNITYLFARAEETCSVRICINGFPVIDGPLFANTEVFDIIGENLVLGENELSAALDVSARAKVPPNLGPVSLALEIRHFQPGGVVCPEEGEKVPLRQVEPQELLAAPEVNAPLALMPDAQPMVFRYLFEGRDQDLGRFLKQPARPVDPEILKDYGYFLQQLFAASDVSRFMTHYEPKLEAMAKARLRAVPDVVQEATAGFSQIMPLGLAEPPQRETIEVTPHCDGRVFEISRLGGAPLIATSGGKVKLPVFVGVVANNLRIVR